LAAAEAEAAEEVEEDPSVQECQLQQNLDPQLTQ
jgi:hypothetical protein